MQILPANTTSLDGLTILATTNQIYQNGYVDTDGSNNFTNQILRHIVVDASPIATCVAVMILLIGVLGNMFGTTVFLCRPHNRKHKGVDRIIGLLCFAGLMTAIVSVPVQLYAFFTGEFPANLIFCQIQGFSLNLLCLVCLWFSSILAMERFLRLVSPHEHRLTFSPLNLSVILSGVFVLLVVEVSGPIYGWAEYAFVPESTICLLHPQAKHIFTYSIIHTSCYVALPFFVTVIAMSYVIVEGVKKNVRLENDSEVLKSSEGMIVLGIAAVISTILIVPYHTNLLMEAWLVPLSDIAKTVSYWLQIIAISCVYPLTLFTCRNNEMISALKEIVGDERFRRAEPHSNPKSDVSLKFLKIATSTQPSDPPSFESSKDKEFNTEGKCEHLTANKSSLDI